ncbi:MAG TPA: cell division protein FtsA [Dehalococcoidia bacterium]|nr:cell division protein FtsA [Dehalococcoidia bacterium]
MSKRSGTVAAVDVGSTKVTVVVADVGEFGETRILGVGVTPAAGLSRGAIDNIGSAREAISTAVQRAEQSCGMRILSAGVSITGSHIQSQNSRGIIAVTDRTRPISEDDKERVLEAASQIAIPTNREVLHSIPRGYWVEGTEQVSDPAGMFGGRVDAEVHIVTAAVSAIQNLTKCVEGAGVQVDNIVLGPLAAAHASLQEQERVQGSALIDIGGSATSLCVFEEGNIAHSACLPLGGTHITQDLARVLRCPWESAETLKREAGAAGVDPSMNGQSVEIEAFGTHPSKQVALTHVSEIIQARLEEIFEVVILELKRAGYLDRLAAGLVVTGGTSELDGIAEFAESRLGLPVRVGSPRGYAGLNELVSTPTYSTALGLADFMLGDRDRVVQPSGYSTAPGLGGGLLRRLATFGRGLIPE